MTILLQRAVSVFASVLEALIFARILLSWIPISRDNPIIQFIYALTEPILGPIRSMLRKSPLGGPGMILDFSPMIAWLLIDIVKIVLLNVIRSL